MEELIRKIKTGDKESATTLIKLFYDEVFLYVLKLTLNKDIALDLTQDIFMRVLKKIHTFKYNHDNIKNWIYKIAYNYVMTYYKLKKNHQYSDELLPLIPSTINIESDLIKNEDHKNMLKTVYKLDTIYRDVIILRFYQDLSINDIALILKTNENTVKTRIRRGLEILKSMLERGDLNYE